MTLRILAAIGKNTIGDFCHDALVASAIAARFDDAELCVYYRDNRPYKTDILRCVPNIHSTIRNDTGGMLPIDCLGSSSAVSEITNLNDPRVRSANIIIAGDMFNAGMHSDLQIPLMELPESWVDAGKRKLVSLGLDPSKWFAVIYWKSPGYEYRKPNPTRDIHDPSPYLAAANHILDEGGQVVRIGHPTPVPPLNRPGYVDLSREPEPHWLQMCAVAWARFMLSSASGPSVYGCGFGTPTAICDQHELSGAWRDGDYILMRVEKETRHTAEAITRAADEMIASTHDTRGFAGRRSLRGPGIRPNAVSFPLKITPPEHLLIPPTQRGMPRE